MSGGTCCECAEGLNPAEGQDGGSRMSWKELCHGVGGGSEEEHRHAVPMQAGTEAAPHPNTAPRGCSQHVPSPHPTLCVPCRWFHGKITREQAERLLYPPETGLFLVRESTNYPGDYTLCVSCEGKVEHYRIIYSSSKLSIDEEVYFENLMQLVEVRPQLASPSSSCGDIRGHRGLWGCTSAAWEVVGALPSLLPLWGGDAGDRGTRRREKDRHPWPRAAPWWDLRARHRLGGTPTPGCHPAHTGVSPAPRQGCHPPQARGVTHAPPCPPSITPRTQMGSAPASSNRS